MVDDEGVDNIETYVQHIKAARENKRGLMAFLNQQSRNTIPEIPERYRTELIDRILDLFLLDDSTSDDCVNQYINNLRDTLRNIQRWKQTQTQRCIISLNQLLK